MMANEITGFKYAVVEQRMVQQEVDTPQGRMVVQQPMQVAVVFRGPKEVQRYIEEQMKTGQPIVLQQIAYNVDNEDKLEYYYREEEDSCH